MGKSKAIEEYIIDTNKNQFIYGYDNENREKIINNIISKNEIAIDESKPMAVRVDDFGLPNIKYNKDKINKFKVNLIAKEYLNIAIADSILKQTKKHIDIAILDERLQKLYKLINVRNKSKYYTNINNFDTLLRALEETKRAYLEYYIDYLRESSYIASLYCIPINHIQISLFVDEYKKSLNNNSHIVSILNNHGQVSSSSINAVNSIMKTDKLLALKTFTEPTIWNSNMPFEQNHYEIIKLDDSYDEYTKRLKR